MCGKLTSMKRIRNWALCGLAAIFFGCWIATILIICFGTPSPAIRWSIAARIPGNSIWRVAIWESYLSIANVKPWPGHLSSSPLEIQFEKRDLRRTKAGPYADWIGQPSTLSKGLFELTHGKVSFSNPRLSNRSARSSSPIASIPRWQDGMLIRAGNPASPIPATSSAQMSVWLLYMPNWMVNLLAIPPLIWGIYFVRRRLRNKRMKNPFSCTGCGYDLRATPDRCPECGKMAKNGASA